VGVAGTETFNGTVLPLSTTGKTFINEFDASATASGDLNAQTSAAASPVAVSGYAFVLNGVDIGECPLAIGGVINVDSAGGISGTGSIFDINDCGSGLAGQGETLAASTVSAPDAFGRVTFTLNPTFLAEITLNGYIVDANHIRLTEGNNDGYGGTTGGFALTQSVPPGSFTNASAAGNTYVVGLGGEDTVGFLQAVGQLTPASAGTVSGFIDFNDLVTVEPASPDPVTAPAYSVDSAGAGDYTIEGVTDGVNSYNVQLYLDGNGNALAITLDTTDVLGGHGAQQTGAGSFTAASFSGPYGFGTGGVDFNYDGPFSTVGPVTADGVGTITGFADVNWLNFFAVADETFTAAPVSGTFNTTGVAAANGIFSAGSITGLDLTTCTLFTAGAPGCTADVFNYYLLDATGDNIAIETDFNQLTLGVFQQQ
jgi:hypothetical protein